MSMKCICHLGEYEIKDAKARKDVGALTGKVNDLASRLAVLELFVQTLTPGGGTTDSYTVAFYTRKQYNDNGVIGYTEPELIATETYTKGAAIVMPNVPTLAGYTFAWDSVPETATGNLTVIGTYALEVAPEEPDEPEEPDTPETPTVKYKANITVVKQYFTATGDSEYTDPETIAEAEYEEGTDIYPYIANLVAVNGPSITGYYRRYYANDVVIGDGSYIITGDVEIKCEYLCQDYALDFKLDDGTLYTSERYPYTYPIEYPFDPTKDGYTFKGWDKTITTMPAGDTTITAVFEEAKILTATVRQGTTEPSATDVITIEFEEGMTWGEWFESSYYNSAITKYVSPNNSLIYPSYLGNCWICVLTDHNTSQKPTSDTVMNSGAVYEIATITANAQNLYKFGSKTDIVRTFYFDDDMTWGAWMESNYYDPDFIAGQVTGLNGYTGMIMYYGEPGEDNYVRCNDGQYNSAPVTEVMSTTRKYEIYLG